MTKFRCFDGSIVDGRCNSGIWEISACPGLYANIRLIHSLDQVLTCKLVYVSRANSVNIRALNDFKGVNLGVAIEYTAIEVVHHQTCCILLP